MSAARRHPASVTCLEPLAQGAAAQGPDALVEFVRRHPRLFVLTGAGVSTESGIPGYRDAEGRWKRTTPVLLHDFLHSEAARRRYWARSMVGWPIVAAARPNAAHRALAQLEAAGNLRQLVTQNVDSLHQQAGSARVIELHGSIGRVICVDCGARDAREAIQRRLEAENSRPLPAAIATAPDGDADLDGDYLDAFHVPTCAGCAGILKPDVVFFGEGVPRNRVRAALQSLEQVDALLIIGSSLMVYSGYRFCEAAAAKRKPMAALNLGRTRADHFLALKIELPCAGALAGLVEALGIDP